MNSCTLCTFRLYTLVQTQILQVYTCISHAHFMHILNIYKGFTWIDLWSLSLEDKWMGIGIFWKLSKDT